MIKKIITFLLLVSGFVLNLEAKDEGRIVIEGHVFDAETKEPIVYATIAIENTEAGTTTNEEGNFLFRGLKPGKYTLIVNCIGYNTCREEIEVIADKIAHAHIELKPRATELEGVVVSANRNETSRKEAPVIVNVLSEKQFEKTNAQDLVQALPYQSGVRVEYNCQNCGFPQVRINGLDGPYTQLLIDSRPVMSALSGIYGLEQIPVNMVERVEVVKGGGSALFGANAIAGTINIITKEPLNPSFSLSTDAQLIGGSTYAQNVNANGTVISKNRKAGASFYQTFRTRDAYDANGDGFSEIGTLKNHSFGIKSYYRANEKHKFGLEYHTINEKRRGGNNFDMQPHQSDICEMTEHNINSIGLNHDYLSLNGKHRVNSYISAQYIDRRSYYGSHRDTNAYGKSRDLTLLAGIMANHRMDRLLFAPASITYGLEYNTNDLDDRVPNYGIMNEQTTHLVGAYLQSEWTMKKFNLLLGFRTDKHNMLDKPVFVPRINLLYKPNSDLQFRLSYSSGYRAPQAYEEDFHITQVGGKNLRTRLAEGLRPEYSHSFSLSVDKYHRFGENFQFNVLVETFCTVLDDVFAFRVIAEDTLTNSVYQERYNASGATVYGVSHTFKLTYKDISTLSLGFTLQSSEYRQEEFWSEDPSVAGTKHLLRSPDCYGFLSFDVKPMKRLSINVAGTYTGSMKVAHYKGYIEKDRLETTPDFFDMNCSLSYELKKTGTGSLLLRVGVNNLFDAYQKDFDTGIDRDAGYIYGPTQPRTFYAGLKFMI